MSDGYFNRSLLPSGGNYVAGVRAGEVRMRTRALRALHDTLAALPGLDAATRARFEAAFIERLDGH